MAVLRREQFLDTDKIESSSGVTFGVRRPTKDPANPLWPTLADSAPDWGIGYVSARYDGTKTRLWTNTFPRSLATVHLGNPETTDGVTFTRPVKGLINIGGNTNNNLVTPGGLTRNFYHLAYEQGHAQPYVLVVQAATSLPMEIRIFRSADGEAWTLVKTIASPNSNGYCEPMSILQRSDGRWLILIQTYDTGTMVRGIGAILGPADGTLTGTWTPQGTLSSGNYLPIKAGVYSRQYYHASAFVQGELIIVLAGMFGGYNGAAPSTPYEASTYDRIHEVELLVSRADDGINLVTKDLHWLASSGLSTGWDCSEVVIGNSLVEIDGVWYFHYTGDENPHHTVEAEITRLLGRASMPARCLGYIEGPGTAILDPVTTGLSTSLEVVSTGTVEVELLDPTSSEVLTHYARADCDAIPADSIAGHTVTWDGEDSTPSTYKPKLYLAAGARVYFTEIADGTSGVVGHTWALPSTVKQAVGRSWALPYAIEDTRTVWPTVRTLAPGPGVFPTVRTLSPPRPSRIFVVT